MLPISLNICSEVLFTGTKDFLTLSQQEALYKSFRKTKTSLSEVFLKLSGDSVNLEINIDTSLIFISLPKIC